MGESTTASPSKGWQGAVLKLFGATDFTITVTGSEVVTDSYVRVFFTGGGLLEKTPVHPTMWVRLWFEADGSLHQRGYTLVDPDPASDSFAIEFAVHEGTAARWAQHVTAGETINATVMGSKFAYPDPAPAGWFLAGDAASLAAINSLLDAISASAAPEVPVTLWFEYQHASDRDLPLRARPGDTVHWIPRGNGSAVVDAVRAAATPSPDHHGWVALEAAATRAVTSILKKEFSLGRKSVTSMAYWTEGKSAG